VAPETADAVIVGAGASGGVVASELARAGLRVVLLERGTLPDVKDYALHDELATGRGGRPMPEFGPSDTRHPREFRVRSAASFRLIQPADGAYAWMGGLVGGGQINYAGLMWRRPPIDFRMKSEYGRPGGTTLEDWPLTYDDLEPCYEKAEYELGVSGEAGVNPFEGRRAKPFPLPPVELVPGDRLVREAAIRKGLHPFTVPLGIVTRDYRGRTACIQHPHCNGYVCEVGAKSTILSALLPGALATRNLRLVTGAVARDVVCDGRGRPHAVSYFDRTGKLVTQTARIIVLAASATETPRLLLNSRSRWFPGGLGNGNGWVGRNLMGHIGPQAFGIFDSVVNDGVGPGTGIAVDDFHGRIPGIIGGGVIYSRTDVGPIAFNDYRPDGAPGWGAAHKKYQRENYHHYYRFTSPAEDMPQFENRVEVSPEVRDAWGIPVARVTHGWHQNDLSLFEFLRGKMELILREAGAREIYFNQPGKGRISLHQNGTCRMGNDPKTSVVDRHGRLHEADNVFVVDGSCFVTSGGRNPVLTIQALAYWCAAHMIREWKSGSWRKS
jgi:choline dehydrogenase-like flavoprotein